jgi:hypothetical protein
MPQGNEFFVTLLIYERLFEVVAEFYLLHHHLGLLGFATMLHLDIDLSEVLD